jgi:hypothetical protein
MLHDTREYSQLSKVISLGHLLYEIEKMFDESKKSSSFVFVQKRQKIHVIRYFNE